MRSTSADRRRRAALLLALAIAGTARAQPEAAPAAPPAASAGAALARAATIERAAAQLRADPLLSGKHKTHTLQWHSDPDEKPDDEDDEANRSLRAWLLQLARFLSDTSRFLVYGGAIVLLALLAVSLRHVVQLRAASRRLKAAAAVSHVRDLDVRPESLPDDIGAAAWVLWRAGQEKAALSLLYRGALSRLIHRHGVPIQASSTEGECLALASGHVSPAAQRYLTQVVRAWEANSYGARALSAAMGEALCGGFATRLDAAPAAGDAAAAPGAAE
jgi:hypothetical protein